MAVRQLVLEWLVAASVVAMFAVVGYGLVFAVVSLETVVAAWMRDRRRRAWAELVEAFGARRVAELDESLERAVTFDGRRQELAGHLCNSTNPSP
jgi:hypothetical protein